MQKITARQYFEESLNELIEQKPFERITVREIAENCGMTTRTFYNYFQDKYDLILWTYSSRFEEYLENCDEAIDFCELFSFIADHMLNKRKLYLSAMQDSASIECFMNTVIDYSCHRTMDYIQKVSQMESIPDSLAFSIRYFYQGGFHIGFEYLKGEIKMTKELYLECVQNVMPDNLKSYLVQITT